MGMRSTVVAGGDGGDRPQTGRIEKRTVVKMVEEDGESLGGSDGVTLGKDSGARRISWCFMGRVSLGPRGGSIFISDASRG